MAESPCKNCTRVKEPVLCCDKNCGEWRNWFIARWEAMRKNNAPTSEIEFDYEAEDD